MIAITQSPIRKAWIGIVPLAIEEALRQDTRSLQITGLPALQEGKKCQGIIVGEAGITQVECRCWHVALEQSDGFTLTERIPNYDTETIRSERT